MRRHGIATFDELMRRSTEDIAWFWNAVIADLDIRFRVPYDKVVDLSRGEPWAQWCIGGRMNIVDNCLDKWTAAGAAPPQGSRAGHIAVRWEGEEGATRALSYGELNAQVSQMAAALRSLGVGKGDVVAIFMPMTVEIAVALLAIAKIGAIILPLFSGYGAEAVASRLRSSGAKAMFTADGFYRRGQRVAMKPVADQAIALAVAQPGTKDAAGACALQHQIVFHRTSADIANIPMTAGRDHWWHDLAAREYPSQLSATEDTSAEDPLMIIYTSGTTGQPKGALHTHCGFPIKAAQDLVHCLDVGPDDTVYWVTDLGWMMGPWLIFGTALIGATMVFYDGAPDYSPTSNHKETGQPGADRVWSLGAGRLWNMVERHKISVLGISPTLVRGLMGHGEEPVRRHDVSSLRVLGSTGEPWNTEPWNWFFRVVGGGRLPIINYSGGTETSGGILGGNMLLPMKPASFSGAVPGMAADVVDDQGRSLRGAVGELVIRRPWIGMTRGFWKAPERYFETYWSRFPGIWVHGDWAAIDADGLWYILGRSDDTIKVAGKRLGPAEVETILVGHPAVAEAACIGVPDPLKGQDVLCFCVLRAGHEPSDALREALRARVIEALGKPLKPREILFVNDLPKTRNAKVMRRVVRAAYLGESLGDITSLENPAAIEEIKKVRR
ncbi:MAG: AMP-dependent synthetase [Acidobacteria bacterium]|nr:AMP-dependent synthetase [Acidobacteriota bacterium]